MLKIFSKLNDFMILLWHQAMQRKAVYRYARSAWNLHTSAKATEAEETHVFKSSASKAFPYNPRRTQLTSCQQKKGQEVWGSVGPKRHTEWGEQEWNLRVNRFTAEIKPGISHHIPYCTYWLITTHLRERFLPWREEKNLPYWKNN